MLNLEFAHGRSGLQPTVENLPKGHHGSGGFFGGFLRWIFGHKMQRKIRRKKSPENQSNPPVKPPSARRVFFDWEGLLLEASSEQRFWDTLWLPSRHGRGSHAEMHLQSLSCCWWEGHGLKKIELVVILWKDSHGYSRWWPHTTHCEEMTVNLCAGQIGSDLGLVTSD